MIMKKNIIAAILLTAAVAFSCTTKEESSKELINDGSIVYNPTATIKPFVLDGPATKTALTIDATTGAKFTFVDGDALGVFPYDPEVGTQAGFTVTSSDETSCTFNGGGFGLKSGQLYAVYYPYSEEGNVDDPTEENIYNVITEFPVSYLGQRQTSTDGETFSISDFDYLVDNGVTPVSNACEFEMQHVGALLVLDVTFPQAGNYTELALTSDGATFITSGTIDLTASDIAVEAEGSSNSIILALGEEGGNGLAIAADQQVRFCMMAAPVDLSSATVTLKATTSTGTELSKVITKASRAVVAGNAYRYLCNLDASAEEEDEPTNLSEYETANSYVVNLNELNPVGYTFNATVAGNGVAAQPAGILGAVGMAANLIYPASPAISGTSIRVNLNQNNCITDATYADGVVSFKATGAEGNAKITLYDANGDGVWTWLLWCTDKPGKVTIPTADGSKTYTVMDRNLGAITPEYDAANPENTYGLYYMFGDPLGYTVAEWTNNGSRDGYRMIDELAYSPNKPYCDYSNAGGWTWFNLYQATNNPRQVFAFLWGAYGTGAGDTWGATFDRQPGTASFKTLYDPCPVGYKVMAYDVLLGYNSTTDYANFTADEHGVYVAGSEATAFFPYAGNIHNGGYTWMAPDTYLYLWTSAFNNTNMAWSYMIYKKDSDRAVGGEDHSHIISRGMPVRCMK